jgi:hypothetical protein
LPKPLTVSTVLVVVLATTACDGRPSVASTTSSPEDSPTAQQRAEWEKGTPRIAFEPRIRDVGQVREGQTVTATYAVRNIGDGLLKIASVRSDCATCTRASIDRKELPPGEGTELTVEHTGEPPGGAFARYVTVESNNADDPTVAVIIQGEVTLEFTVDPLELDFGEVVAGQGATASLRLTRNFGDPLLLGPLGALPAGLMLTAAPKPAAEVGEPVVLELALGPDVPAGTYAEELRVPVNGRLHQELVMPVRARVVEAVRLATNDVFFGMVPVHGSAGKVVPVIVAAGDPVEHVELADGPDWLRVELAEAPGGQQSVRFLLGPAQLAGAFSAEVRLRAHRGGATHSLAARCYGIRGE